MASEWRNEAIGTLCDMAYGKIVRQTELSPTGYPVWNGYSIIGCHTDYMFESPEVVITCRGVGGTGKVYMTPPYAWITNLVISMIPKRSDVLDKKFLLWAMRASDRSGIITGSAQYQITIQHLSTHEIPVPPLSEQKAIACILGMLEEKIELNRKMNETLEEIARAIFNSWFVDFDPGRAKLEGRKSEIMNAEIASLFPVSFEESKLGQIPKGWKACTIGSLVKESIERIGNSEQNTIVLSAVSSGRLVSSDDHFKKRVYSKNIKNYKKVLQWDFAYNPSRINIGSIGLQEGNFVGAVSPVYVVFRASELTAWWLRFHLRREQIREEIRQLCSGSVRQSLKYRDLASITLPVPPDDLLSVFSEKYSQLQNHRNQIDEETKTLEQIRNILLPKLLNGKIRIRDAEKFLGNNT